MAKHRVKIGDVEFCIHARTPKSPSAFIMDEDFVKKFEHRMTEKPNNLEILNEYMKKNVITNSFNYKMNKNSPYFRKILGEIGQSVVSDYLPYNSRVDFKFNLLQEKKECYFDTSRRQGEQSEPVTKLAYPDFIMYHCDSVEPYINTKEYLMLRSGIYYFPGICQLCKKKCKFKDVKKQIKCKFIEVKATTTLKPSFTSNQRRLIKQCQKKKIPMEIYVVYLSKSNLVEGLFEIEKRDIT